ncbi:glycosyltransferase family 4 protein [Curtobacterium sp. VKM Ac-2884]|uniref:glycosyltransferase family 4 protein n=1 Tax=Curtobacterium sp. VKM Ac-2884 TaxID=2783818 RepID=UPI00188D2C02|nr:glycosyltransferase [Curtobacterium sp. VKM Ac-2884]MBF4603156.1 glycosyltransferase [Curtobacterium sp. VKM Ac-2884]
MKLLMLSGIFSQSDEYRATHMAETPDSLLADGLAAAGVDVTTAAPYFRGDWSRYDVVHLNHLTNACVRALLPNRGPSGRTKIVFTHHTSGWKPWKFRVVRNLIERRADSVVVFSDDERQRLGGRVPAGKIDIIPSGLAVERFDVARRSRPVGDEPLELLYVGQLVEFKRLHLALELMHRLLRAGQPVRLRIISHRETLRPELMAEAARLGLTDLVEYLGTRTRDQIGHEMAKSHFLVLPSYREALSTVTSEAAVTGLPVLLFNVSGSSDQVPIGWERPDISDTERFFNLALERTRNYHSAEQLWAQNAATVRAHLSVDRMVDQHIDLYHRLTMKPTGV